MVESAGTAGSRGFSVSEDSKIGRRCKKISLGVGRVEAFTLVELIVVMAIISMLLAITVPALHRVKAQVRAMVSMRNQKEITNAVNLFAMDSDEQYPQSVATVGFGETWNWSDPRKMIGNQKRTPGLYRAMSSYLSGYIADAETMFCPNAPQKYKYLQESWEAGDKWDNPETPVSSDPMTGTYCYYWNYVGYLGEGPYLFVGPKTPASMGRQSKLLVTDYCGYGNWQRPNAFGSCEQLAGGGTVPEHYLHASYWTLDGDPDQPLPDVTLRAGYTDGHVETYTPSEGLGMRVPNAADGEPPYPDGPGSPGTFYIPRNAQH
jgi:prepilin-type N-terminal cleavage/methylation domain-containing protein